MCNINFDADREITSGTERNGQRRRILFSGRGGSDFIFFVMYCNFYFIMLPFSLFASVYFFIFGGGEGGCIILKEEKRCVLFDCVKVYLLPLSLTSFASSPPNSYITLRWRDES